MVDDTIEQTKAAMRLKAHQARAGFSEQEQADAAEAICRHFFRDIALRPGDVVAAYWRIRDEIDCGPILVRLMDSGCTVVLPVVLGAGQPLEMRVWEPGAALYPSGFGTLAPSPLAPQRQPDTVLLPVLGFDRLGTRLGYGGGYYDRTLAQMGKAPRLIGLAFSAQEFDIVPRLPHDIPLHAIVTESGVRQFGSGL